MRVLVRKAGFANTLKAAVLYYINMHIFNSTWILTIILLAYVNIKYQSPVIGARRKLRKALGSEEWTRQSLKNFPMGLNQEAIFEATDKPEIRMLKQQYVNAIIAARPAGWISLIIIVVGVILQSILH